MKKRIAEIAEMLGKELPFHAIEDKKAEVEKYQINGDPFRLENSVRVAIIEAERELKYLGCYMACRQNDMSYMYRGIYQGNRLYVAKRVRLSYNYDVDFFVQTILAFACNDYDLIERLLPVTVDYVTGYYREMINLLRAVFYKNENIRINAICEARQYLQ